MNPVVHFEMPYEDRDRMVQFYEVVFGWRTEKLGPEMGNYVLVTTTEDDVKPGRAKGRHQWWLLGEESRLARAGSRNRDRRR